MTKPLTIAVVTGGRDFGDRNAVYLALDALAPDVLVTGSASGADSLAEQWAEFRAVWSVRLPVCASLWRRHGPPAGPARNRLMCRTVEGLAYSMAGTDPDGANARRTRSVCIAFPGGKGTANMRKEARETMDVLDGMDLAVVRAWVTA